MIKVISIGLVCPFCGNELSEEANYCCGEANHGVIAYETADMYKDLVYEDELTDEHEVIS